MSENKNLSSEQAVPAPSLADVENAISGVNPDIVLRNLAFWLDVAIARGRWFDAKNQNSDAVPAPSAVSEPEV